VGTIFRCVFSKGAATTNASPSITFAAVKPAPCHVTPARPVIEAQGRSTRSLRAACRLVAYIIPKGLWRRSPEAVEEANARGGGVAREVVEDGGGHGRALHLPGAIHEARSSNHQEIAFSDAMVSVPLCVFCRPSVLFCRGA